MIHRKSQGAAGATRTGPRGPIASAAGATRTESQIASAAGATRTGRKSQARLEPRVPIANRRARLEPRVPGAKSQARLEPRGPNHKSQARLEPRAPGANRKRGWSHADRIASRNAGHRACVPSAAHCSPLKRVAFQLDRGVGNFAAQAQQVHAAWRGKASDAV